MAEGKSHLLGVDLGAGSLKASVIDGTGTLLGEASSAVPTKSPRPGWSEQDPRDWYAALCRAVPAALERAGIRPVQLAALGISAGAHTQVLLDDRDRILRPAILWSDQRADREAGELHDRFGDRIIEIGLNRVNPTWTLAQLSWLQRHEPDLIARVKRLFLAKDYLRYCVTGDWHTDLSDGVGALLADPLRGTWSAELCGLISWPLESLPPIVEATQVTGTVGARAAAETGLIEGLPVVAGSNDTTVEILGAGVARPGQGAIKLATAGVLYQVTEGPRVEPPVSCYPHIVEGLYYTATGTNSCASAHRWLRDTLFGAGAEGETFEAMDGLAAGVAAGSNGLIFHPYMQGERAPYWDPRLRADYIGLTLHHGRGHLARALYEGIAYSIKDLMVSAGMAADRFTEIRIIGGGARSALWRQIVSDVLGAEIIRPANGDASYGAALVAGIGVGLFASASAAADLCGAPVDRCQPDPERSALYDRLFGVYKDAQAKLSEINHRLSGLSEA